VRPSAARRWRCARSSSTAARPIGIARRDAAVFGSAKVSLVKGSDRFGNPGSFDPETGQFYPGLARGGVVMPRPGGTMVNAGEGGEAEVIAPLSRLGGMGNVTNHFHIGSVDSHERIRELADAISDVILSQTRTRRNMLV
jgi:hypothetical protein